MKKKRFSRTLKAIAAIKEKDMLETPLYSDFEKDNLLATQPAILSVKDLSLALKQRVETDFKHVRVRGEISGFKRHTSGHSYFSLKDAETVLDAVCWRGTYLKAPLQDGLEVIATGRLTTYPGRSKYQIVIEQVEAAGEGALLKLLLERKARLQAEGLFSEKRPLPAFPKTIGIVTSPTGAVLHDILHRLQDRYPCHVLVWPTAVQGPGAAEQITAAIKGFNDLPHPQQPDVIIVARGGGSLEDLWCFNEENVVRAAAHSLIPLISAVGHETDTTLIDWAADLRAPTPTAAAELATPVLGGIALTLRQYVERLHNVISRQFDNDRMHLINLGRALPSPQQVMEQTMLRLDDWADRLWQAQTVWVNYQQQTLATLKARLRPPYDLLRNAEPQLAKLFDRLFDSQQRLLQRKQEHLLWQATSLEQNSYQRVLERGFCWVASQNQVVTRASFFNDHLTATLTLQFADGAVEVNTQVTNKAKPL